ncbi:MAG: type and secretion system protein [Acidobacteriaceae bacterium]|nr:type and secretion system protein [Acidobacteriaceae bacterium]
MVRFLKFNLLCGLLAGYGLVFANNAAAQAVGNASGKSVALIRRVSLLSVGSNVEVEILASEPVLPQTQVVTGPDRLVIDFPNSQPSAELRGLNVNRGEVKNVRVGLFAANPPVTRVVLDLTSAASYHVFPSGKSVIVKFDAPSVAGSGTPHLRMASSRSSAPIVISEDDMPPTLPMRPKARVEVHFNHGMLSIHVERGTLAEVLNEVHRQTGADIPIPPGAQQEAIVADIGPAPARDAMAALLNGSHFNFVIVGSDHDPNELHSVALTSKQGEASKAADSGFTQEYSATNQPPPEPVQGGPVTQPTPDDPTDDTPPPMPEPEGPPPPQ